MEKVRVNDGEEKYELMKQAATVVTLSSDLLKSYVGTYQLKGESRKLKVESHKQELFINLGKEKMPLSFYSDTRFKAKSVFDITGKFLIKNGKVVTLVMYQNGRFDWEKME
ncbi:DUF3471 domain-containing protein [Niastella populi]|uniref:Peptidase S12 Pab87-related C-terminal domain-containing protein n=1 Tax=Niastella populi TaxID=550983 RepID=A0A1V9FE30_9BACT|nr:DUF3471 domain-containing protein [Niastella populi]OQP56456.1 hypothetical protein A4R26_04660 [Niastella populi]